MAKINFQASVTHWHFINADTFMILSTKKCWPISLVYKDILANGLTLEEDKFYCSLFNKAVQIIPGTVNPDLCIPDTSFVSGDFL